MKKILLSAALLIGSLSAMADYEYMVFTYADGTQTALLAEGLVINVDGSSLAITNTEGESIEVDASELVSMQFSDVDPAGVETILAGDSAWDVYNLEGVYAGRFNSLNEARSALAKGIYVIRNQEGETIKLVIGQ